VSRVFVDFGRNRVYALPEGGGEVVVFNDFLEMFEKLRPRLWLLTAIRGSSYQPWRGLAGRD